MTLLIRRAASADIQALDDIARAMGEGRDFARCLLEREVFIAQLDGIAVGSVQFNRHPTYPPFRRLGIPEVQDLMVRPEARRQGVGEALVRHCETLAGTDEVGIGVGLDASFGAAQRLYVRLGYVPDGSGAVYDDVPVRPGELRPVDGFFCLKLVKSLVSST
jgi:GNAT superfamily N-acetyltransferase